MSKIVMLPLDERPCNFDYPAMMPKTNAELVLPPKEIMGDKKIPGDVEKIAKWLKENIVDADACVLSLDTLVYGGIVPSRMHYYSEEELMARVDFIKTLREMNPHMKLYVFGLIMRCPHYSSSDEEPDFYDECGAQLHLYGRYTHKEMLGIITKKEKKDFKRIKKAIKKEHLEDFINRRKLNLSVLMHALEFAADGTVDYFIVPQDDAAVYGFTSIDQIKVRDFLKTNALHMKTAMYPSADDTGLTLLARANAQLANVRPKVYVHYSSSKGGNCIPLVEDRILAETVKYHILAIDGIQVYSLSDADLVLAINMSSEHLLTHGFESVMPYDIERNLAEFVNFMQYALSQDKFVAIADVAWLNTGDTELTKIMQKEKMLMDIHAYAGWNTSSNTIGTTLCQAILYMIGGDKAGNDSFLMHRYFEDIGYMAYVREHVTEDHLPEMGLDYYHADAKEGDVSDLVGRELMKYMSENYPEIARPVKAIAIKMPWVRMFEVDIKLEIDE